MNFQDSLREVFLSEGGYADDPDDHGGATNMGIIQSTYDSYRKSIGHLIQPVRLISKKEAADIYETNYWRAAKCDKLPPPLALCHFDFAVNSGVGRAARKLQEVVGVKIDGKIGPNTLKAVWEYDEEQLVKQYSEARRQFVTRLSKKDGQLKFLKSWLNRTNRCERIALKEIRGRVDRTPR